MSTEELEWLDESGWVGEAVVELEMAAMEAELADDGPPWDEFEGEGRRYWLSRIWQLRIQSVARHRLQTA